MPVLSSQAEYRSRRRDLDFWWPHVAPILHGLGFDGSDPVIAEASSYPTVLTSEAVVKLYGYSGQWREAHAAELAAYRVLGHDDAIPAPRLLASGDLDESWKYLVISRLHGDPWHIAPPGDPVAMAADLGRHVARMHSLPPDGMARYADWPRLDIAAACAGTGLPQHLLPQVNDYVARLPESDAVFSNGDLFEGNILTDGTRVTGLLDWGDTLVIDRHNELAKIHLSVFGGDKPALRAFLDAAAWPRSADFPRRALGWSLVRQAVGIAQHGSGFDNFFLVPKLAAEAADLDDLAHALFEV